MEEGKQYYYEMLRLSPDDVEGIDEEIALMRYIIRESALTRDEKHMLIMVRAANALNKLIRTRHKLEGPRDQFMKGVRNVMKDMVLTLGQEGSRKFLRYCSGEDAENESGNESLDDAGLS